MRRNSKMRRISRLDAHLQQGDSKSSVAKMKFKTDKFCAAKDSLELAS